MGPGLHPVRARPAWQEQLRTAIREGCNSLEPTPQQILHATFFGRKRANADVENLVLYNIGPSFRLPGRNGIRFEHGAAVPTGPNDAAFAFGYRYELTSIRRPSRIGSPTERWQRLTGALPDELPAAALRWRLAGILAPATLDAANQRLRPPWTPELHRILGSAAAETITADPAWPALVAAVNASDWPPADLLVTAAEYLLDALADDTIRPDEYARVLTA